MNFLPIVSSIFPPIYKAESKWKYNCSSQNFPLITVKFHLSKFLDVSVTCVYLRRPPNKPLSLAAGWGPIFLFAPCCVVVMAVRLSEEVPKALKSIHQIQRWNIFKRKTYGSSKEKFIILTFAIYFRFYLLSLGPK